MSKPSAIDRPAASPVALTRTCRWGRTAAIKRSPGQNCSGDLDHPGTDAIVAARLDLLDHAQIFERRQHPRHRALRQADPIGDVGDAGWSARQAAQHGECSLDRLHP